MSVTLFHGSPQLSLFGFYPNTTASLQTMEPRKDTYYFGYGSNLWRDQMHRRCPDSQFKGIGRLPGYRWIINARGYANVVPIEDLAVESWGMVYTLSEADEESLDIYEGVAKKAYDKIELSTEFWPSKSAPTIDVSGQPSPMPMLVYIDPRNTSPWRPHREYVDRMNSGIEDAVAAGIPQKYVDDVLRLFIPPK
jgi:gamma-glutamylcyclotransferase